MVLAQIGHLMSIRENTFDLACQAAAHRRGVEATLAPRRNTVEAALVHRNAIGQREGVVDAIRASQADTEEDIADLDEDEGMTRRALDLLGSGRNDAYKAALAALARIRSNGGKTSSPGVPRRWTGMESTVLPTAPGLRRFLEDELLPHFAMRRMALLNRPLICDQAFGEALDPAKLQKLARYEVHLDRKLERMLSMLLPLKELRRTAEMAEAT